ncbi:MAG: hypothetical protein EB084_16060 [Proteobacteria bacterium]|jgi:hypothetical protein|nr:hypothetical protein [Pseudomonadota bacterium]
MPAYPCAECKTTVDVRDFTCKKCQTKTPFSCTKCSKRMGPMDIFNADQVTFQKPLFCNACGPDVQPMKCPHCDTDVYKASGVADDGVYYHPECYKSVVMQKKVTPALRIGLAIFLGYFSFSQFHFHTKGEMLPISLCVGVIGAVAGHWLGGLMAPRR